VNFGTMCGKQRLVGRHNVLPPCNGRQDEFFCGLIAANKFGNNIDIRIIQNVRRIVGKETCGDVHATIALEVTHSNFCDFYRNANPAPDEVCIIFKDAERARSYRSKTDQSHIDLLFHLIAFLFTFA
jgi:hypothetical protein